jgi:hypothetical protein
LKTLSRVGLTTTLGSPSFSLNTILFFFFAWCVLVCWRWRQQVPMKNM